MTTSLSLVLLCNAIMQEGCNRKRHFHAVMSPLLALVPHAHPFLSSCDRLKYRHTQLQRSVFNPQPDRGFMGHFFSFFFFTLFPCNNLGVESALFSSRSDRARVHASAKRVVAPRCEIIALGFQEILPEPFMIRSGTYASPANSAIFCARTVALLNSPNMREPRDPPDHKRQMTGLVCWNFVQDTVSLALCI